MGDIFGLDERDEGSVVDKRGSGKREDDIFGLDERDEGSGVDKRGSGKREDDIFGLDERGGSGLDETKDDEKDKDDRKTIKKLNEEFKTVDGVHNFIGGFVSNVEEKEEKIKEIEK